MSAGSFQVGDDVLYRPGGQQPAEEGTVTSVSKAYVFVRFNGDRGSKACDSRSLAWLPK